MRCRSAQILMTQRQRELLTPEESGALERHLSRCPACRGAHEELGQTAALLERAEPVLGWRAAPPVPFDLDRALERSGGRAAFVFPAWIGAAGLTACAALLVGVWLLRQSPRTSPASVVRIPPGAGAPEHRQTGTEKRRPKLLAGGPKSRPVPPQRGPALPEPSGLQGPATRQTPPEAPREARSETDDQYLDGYDPALIEKWAAPGGSDREFRKLLAQKLSRIQVRDDFVQLPFPQLASAGTDERGLADAIRQYAKEARLVDARLFRKVTLQVKAASVSELCDDLGKQTGVRFGASRGIADENVTVFVNDQPARGVMREVSRLFGYKWARSGEEGAYRYDLVQDLRSQLAEEEMRNRDVNAALLALDEQMTAYRPHLGQSPEQLQARLATARGAEKARLQELAEKGGWGAARLYTELSPADRLALASGQELTFTSGSEDPNRRLPREWSDPIVRSRTERYTFGLDRPTIEGEGKQFSEYPGAAAKSITLQVQRTELGLFSLKTRTVVNVPLRDEIAPGRPIEHDLPFPIYNTLATGRSPSATAPENARTNAALRKDPAFSRQVSLRPEPAPRMPVTVPAMFRDPDEGPRLTTAEFWEAVHRETGMSVVADYYSRLYPVGAATVESASLFDALCRAGDSLGLRWTPDGAFLLGRSTTFFWDKLKEVPKRHLARWSVDRRQGGGLPLDDLLEIAGLSDAQLDSGAGGQAVRYLWGLQEWGIVGQGGSYSLSDPAPAIRGYARFLAGLPPEQRARAVAVEGLRWTELSPAQQFRLLQLPPPGALAGTDPELVRRLRVRVVYAPAGWYAWSALLGHPPRGAGRTPEAALAETRKTDPGAMAQGVAMSPGNLAVYLQVDDRFHSELHCHRWGVGGAWAGRPF